MEQKSNNLKEVINILNELLQSISKPQSDHNVTTYQNAKNAMQENIFCLTQYANLFTKTEVNKMKLSELCTLLNTLKNNRYFKIQPEQEQEIRNHKDYQELLKALDKKIQELTPGQDIKEIISELEKSENEIIPEETLDKLYEILIKYNLSKEKTLVVFKELMKHINMVLQHQIKETTIVQEKKEQIPEQQLEEQQNNNHIQQPEEQQNDNHIQQQEEYFQEISKEQLIELFNKYGYDFNKVSEKYQKALLNNASLSNIEDMFINLPKYGIKFKETEKTHIGFLLKSSKTVLETIKQICNKYKLSINDISENLPAALMHKTRSQERKRLKSETKMEEVRSSWKGAFEDFCANVELIKNLGYNIVEEMQNSPSIFIYPNSTISLNAKILQDYGFLQNGSLARIGFKLTGLKAINIQDTIDIFIELGEYQYIKSNASRLRLDSKFVQRLYFAKKDGRPIKRTKGTKTVFTGIDSTLDRLIDLESIKHTVFDKDTDATIKSTLETALKDIDTARIDYTAGRDDIDILNQKYRLDEIRYQFQGIIISAKKVERIYPILLSCFKGMDKEKLLLYAITFNSMMSQDEFDTIKNIIIAKEKRI